MFQEDINEIYKSTFFDRIDSKLSALLDIVSKLNYDVDKEILLLLKKMSPELFENTNLTHYLLSLYDLKMVHEVFPEVNTATLYHKVILPIMKNHDLNDDKIVSYKVYEQLMYRVRKALRHETQPFDTHEFVDLVLENHPGFIFELVALEIFKLEQQPQVDRLKLILSQLNKNDNIKYAEPISFWKGIPSNAYDFELFKIISEMDSKMAFYGAQFAIVRKGKNQIMRDNLFELLTNKKATIAGLNSLFSYYIESVDDQELLSISRSLDTVHNHIHDNLYDSGQEDVDPGGCGFMFKTLIKELMKRDELIKADSINMFLLMKFISISEDISESDIFNKINGFFIKQHESISTHNFEDYIQSLFSVYVESNGFECCENIDLILSPLTLRYSPIGNNHKNNVRLSPLNLIFKSKNKSLFTLSDQSSMLSVSDMTHTIIKFMKSRYNYPVDPMVTEFNKQTERCMNMSDSNIQEIDQDHLIDPI